jgi:hypothetical protein
MQILSWVVVAMVIGINAYLVVVFVGDNMPPTWPTYLITSILGVLYIVFLGYISVSPSHKLSSAKAAEPSSTW